MFHFLPTFDATAILESAVTEEIMANPVVVSAVENIRGAANSAARLAILGRDPWSLDH